MISLFTDNRMLIYGLSVLSLRLYEDTLYIAKEKLTGLMDINGYAIYLNYSLFNQLGYYVTKCLGGLSFEI
ncbi:MAG: hypothetical protein GX895_09865 [Clostridiales bacterium]|nr:hypothetical protein [Clostridiales bacterium]